jgi:2-dehydropantoate 2-reductase
MTKVAVIGPGAIGGTLAAWLAQAPTNELTVCSRTPFEELVVEVPGGRTLTVRPTVLTDPEMAPPVDWVLAVTKTYDTEGAAHWLRRLVGPTTRVAVVQNGVEHEKRFPTLSAAGRLLPVIIDIPAERTAPGRTLQRRHGDITIPEGALGRSFIDLFVGTELGPKMTDDFLSAAWRKLVLNAGAVVNALTLKPAGIIREEKAARLIRAIVTEALHVGQAIGATLDDSLPDEVIARYRSMPPEQVNSLLADRLAHRPLEVDARNGVIVRLGAAHAIPTPLTEMAVTLLEVSVS